jgi:hypothetical protein
VPGFFVPRLLLALRLHLHLVDAPLGFDHCGIADRRLLLARAIAAVAVASAAIAPTAPVLFAFTLWRARLLPRLLSWLLCFRCKLMKLRRFALHGRLRRLR